MKPIQILSIDDDQLLLATLVEYFALCHQWIACPAQGPEQALDLIQRQRFDAVTTDIMHPGMDGLAFTQQVHDLGGPPVIIMSGYEYPGKREEAFASGTHACLRKPFKLERLAEIIKLVTMGVPYIGDG
ncbi:MAG: response regulator [Desulfobacteraceae bacterium]|nr:response regulator [Desulfobacteraceae bacterium]